MSNEGCNCGCATTTAPDVPVTEETCNCGCDASQKAEEHSPTGA